VKSETRVRRKWETPRSVFLALLLGVTVRVGVTHAYSIEGPSMEPNIVEGDHVCVARWAYGLSIPGVTHAVVQWSTPSAGEVVVAQSPFDEQDVIKRVVGVPGDRIEIRDGVVHRNGTALRRRTLGPCDPEEQLDLDPTCMLHEERIGATVYRTSEGTAFEALDQAVTVPPGHVFLLGDHRDRSNDSRVFGPVETSRVRGYAIGL